MSAAMIEEPTLSEMSIKFVQQMNDLFALFAIRANGKEVAFELLRGDELLASVAMDGKISLFADIEAPDLIKILYSVFYHSCGHAEHLSKPLPAPFTVHS